VSENPHSGSTPKISGWRSARIGSAAPAFSNDDQAISSLLLEAVDQARRVTQSDGAFVALRDAEGMVCRGSSGNAPVVGSRPAADSGFTGECLSSARVMICQDAENDSRIGAELARSIGLGSAVAVPISSDGSTLGVVEVLSSRPFAFDALQVTLLEKIAAKLAGVLVPKKEFARPVLVMASAPVVVEAPPPVFLTEEVAEPEGRSTSWLWLIAIVPVLIAVAAYLYLPGPGASSDSTPAPVAETVSVGSPRDQPSTPVAARPAETRPVPAPDKSLPKQNVEGEPAGGNDSSSREDQSPPSASRDEPAAKAETSDQNAENVPTLKPGKGNASATESKVAPPDVQLSAAATAAPELALKTAIPIAPVIPAAPTVPPPNFSSQKTFKGHSGWISSLAFSPDGQRLASSSWDRSVKVWEVPSGEQSSTITRKMMEVQTLAFSPDGRLLATENSANAVTFWDTATRKEVLTLPSNKSDEMPGKNWVYSIAFSPDSRWLATGLDDKTIRVWDVATGHPVFDLPTERRVVTYVAFSPDGRYLASGKDEKTIAIWDVASRKIVHTLIGHKKSVYAVAFSPNGRWLASASGDKSVKLWDVASGHELRTLTGHNSNVTSVAFSPDGRWLASGSWDKTTKIWDAERGQEVQTLANTNPVYAIAFDGRGGWLASGTQDGTIKLWHSSH
jgi:uncharacterized protein with WD repeat